MHLDPNISKSSAISIREIITGLILIGIFAGGVGFYRAQRLYFANRINSPEKVSLFIREKMPLQEVIQQLLRKGVRIDKNELLWATKMLGWRSAEKGHYIVSGRYTYPGLIRKLALGQQDPVRVMVLPGIDKQTFIESVSARMFFKPDSLRSVLDDKTFLATLDSDPKSILGRLWPDTYQFYWTASPQTVVTKMVRSFEENKATLGLDNASKLGLTEEEVLTLASIVEWESKDPEEKKMIAGLYLNRIKKGMRLQADPTVAYAIGSRRRLTFEDYKYEHPYNTYRIDGLPPGPINNPSVESIRAALNPVSHNYVYMVASPTGKHVFTSTWSEHKVESEKWRRWIRLQVKKKQQRESNEG